MLVTALSPVIATKSSKIAHYAMDNDFTLKGCALKLAFVTKPSSIALLIEKMVKPYVASGGK